MAKSKTKAKGKPTNGKPAPQADGKRAGQGEENVSGYFRMIFEENPKLLKGRSNDELLRRWLADHPGHAEVPQKIKYNLANVKSVMRKKLRKRGGRPAKSGQPEVVAGALEAAGPRAGTKGLEALEEQIDECLDLAKRLDRAGLDGVIGLLRRARNQVVWKAGQ